MKLLSFVFILSFSSAFANPIRINHCDYQTRDGKWTVFWSNPFSYDSDNTEEKYLVSMQGWDAAYCIYTRAISEDTVEAKVVTHKTKYAINFDYGSCTASGQDYQTKTYTKTLHINDILSFDSQLITPSASMASVSLVDYNDPRSSDDICIDQFVEPQKTDFHREKFAIKIVHEKSSCGLR